MRTKPLNEYPKIVCTFADLKYNKGGVYFLYSPDGLQYIGESATVLRRIRSHLYGKLRGLDVSNWRIEIVKFQDYGNRRRAEHTWIEQFKPPLNKFVDYAALAVRFRAMWTAKRQKASND